MALRREPANPSLSTPPSPGASVPPHVGEAADKPPCNRTVTGSTPAARGGTEALAQEERAIESIALPEMPAVPSIAKDSRALILARGAALIPAAKSIAIADDITYQLAADFRRQQTKRHLDFVESLLRPNIARLHTAHKDALADLQLLQRDALAADTDLKRRMEQYQLAERRRKEEERLARERAIAEERARLLAEELAFASEVEDDQGSLEILEEMAAPPAPVCLPAVMSAVKAEGATTRFRQRFRVLDVTKIKRQYLKLVVDEEKVQQIVEQLGKKAEEEVGVGGIEWYEEAIVGSRK